MFDSNDVQEFLSQENEPELMEELLKLHDPRNQFIKIIQMCKNIVELSRDYIVVPRDSQFDALVEKRVKTNLVAIYNRFCGEVLIIYNKALELFDKIIMYHNDNLAGSTLDKKVKTGIASKLEFIISGIKEPIAFEWSIEHLQESLVIPIDFAAEVNTLFAGCPQSAGRLKETTDSCESLNHQYLNAIRLLTKTFGEITHAAAQDAISKEQCSKWLQDIVKEIVSKECVIREQQNIDDAIKSFKALLPSSANPTPATNLSPPDGEIPMTDFSKTKNPPFSITSETSLSQFHQDFLKTVMDTMDFSELEKLFSSIGEDKDEIIPFMHGFINGYIQAVAPGNSSNQSTQRSDSPQIVPANPHTEEDETPPSLTVTKTQEAAKTNNDGASLVDNLRHTLLLPPSSNAANLRFGQLPVTANLNVASSAQQHSAKDDSSADQISSLINQAP